MNDMSDNQQKTKQGILAIGTGNSVITCLSDLIIAYLQNNGNINFL